MHTVAMSSLWRELVIQLNKYIKNQEKEEKNLTTQKAVKKKLKSVKKKEVLSYSLPKILWREESCTLLNQYCLQLLQWKF